MCSEQLGQGEIRPAHLVAVELQRWRSAISQYPTTLDPPFPFTALAACSQAGPHNHLFSDLDMGFGTRPFKSGGDKPRGAYAGANNTFWNLRASLPAANPPLLQLPECDFGPLLNFIGR